MTSLFEAHLPAILAAPEDDAPRLVLADALMEVGDPLGEFIRLQVENANQPGNFARRGRASRLWLEHRAKWLPPGVDPDSSLFRRGLFDEGVWKSKTQPEHFAWRTVRVLRCDHLHHPNPMPWSTMARLRDVIDATPMVTTELQQQRPATLETLTLGPRPVPMPVNDVKALLDALPGLTRLELRHGILPLSLLAPLLEGRARPLTIRVVLAEDGDGGAIRLDVSPERLVFFCDTPEESGRFGQHVVAARQELNRPAYFSVGRGEPTQIA